MPTEPMSRAAFEQALRDKGCTIFTILSISPCMRGATPEQIRGWVANRFYYQLNIPLKDAAIWPTATMRSTPGMGKRIIDHDGTAEGAGGIKPGCNWARPSVCTGKSCSINAMCCLACALRSMPTSTSPPRRLEGNRQLVADRTRPQIHQSRLDSWPEHYPGSSAGLSYFRTRLSEAPGRGTDLRITWIITGPSRPSSMLESCSSSWMYSGACSTPCRWPMSWAVPLPYGHRQPAWHRGSLCEYTVADSCADVQTGLPDAMGACAGLPCAALPEGMVSSMTALPRY